ncbi:uncharacterized protein F54H12.2-like [Lepidochelys kempii]|uniref:uncharacterized protein F54H12.2-like n=1 Tax=Lepidochelys kempii TaxID=8472 RepID=UPI003C6F8814
MAFVHCGSEECNKSKLGLFQIAPTQTSIEKSIYVEVPPVSGIVEAAPINFFIAGNGIDYMDLNNTLLYLCYKIVKGDRTELTGEAEVGLLNYSVASIFSQLDVTLGDCLVSQSNNCYPYMAFIESMINYSDDTLAPQFPASLFYKDTLRQHKETEMDGRNLGFVGRAKLAALSRMIELLGHLHSNLFLQEKLLLNDMDVNIKLKCSKDAFRLMGSAAAGFKLHIVPASLFVKKVHVALGVRLGHTETLLTANTKYSVDHIPTKPLQPDFEAGHCMKEYMNLVQTAGKHMKDRSLLINHEEFAQGYTLFTFDLSPDQEYANHYYLIKTGNLRVEIRFGKALTVTINMIVYGVFDNVIELNQRRNILFHYM